MLITQSEIYEREKETIVLIHELFLCLLFEIDNLHYFDWTQKNCNDTFGS